jgi:hypothetical protein
VARVSKTDAVEVAAVSWVVELPRDLGLEEGVGPQLMNNLMELPGWSGRYEELPDWSEGPPDAAPIKRLRFRRAHVDIGMPTAATDLAFGYLRRLEGPGQRAFEKGLRKRIKQGAKEWKTVCQLTRWYVGDAMPDPPADAFDPEPDSLIRTDFFEMLGDLDLWLQAYGLSSGQIDIGSLSLHDLPAKVPWIVDVSASPEGPRTVSSGMLPIHSRMPNLVAAEGNLEAGRSASLLMVQGPEAFPFFLPLSLLYQAQGHALAGRGRQAVIDMGTAVESLVGTTIKEAMRMRGSSKAEIGEVFEKQWKTVFNRVLLETLGTPIGAGGPAHSKWWAEAYKLRTKVVHAGAPVTSAQGEGAVARTRDLFEWIGERLRAQEDLAEIGEAIRFDRPAGDAGPGA